MPQGGTLRLRTRQEGGKVLIEVGIREREYGGGARENLTPYYTSKAQGTDWDWRCAICGERSWSTVRVQSEAGRGTTFVIELPAGFLDRNVALDGDVVVWKEKILTAKYAKKCREGRKEKLLRGRLPTKAHLLIVDDEANTLASLARAFRLAGMRLRCAITRRRQWNGQDAEVDLILSDVRMPGKDGLTLLEELKAQGVTAPVVMMSGQADIEMAVAATRLGALDFLEKQSPRKNFADRGECAEAAATGKRERQLKQRLGKHEVVWQGAAMQRVMAQVARVAASETRVCDSWKTNLMAEWLYLE